MASKFTACRFARCGIVLLAASLLALAWTGASASIPAAAQAQSFADSHCKVSLIAEDPSIAAGHTAWVGVLFDLDKGWHIYWENPGDSGEAPRIQWQLPAGYRAGDFRWPVPVRLGSATVVDYGYEGRVLLAAPVTVPEDYRPGAPTAFAADVRYIVCREVCIPAKAHVTLSLPSGSGTAAGTAELFRDTRALWPKPMPPGWKVRAREDRGRFVLTVETGTRESKAVFFPLDEDQVDNAAAQTVTPSEHGAQISLKKSDQLLKPIAVLKGVLVLSQNRAFEVAAPVAPNRP